MQRNPFIVRTATGVMTLGATAALGVALLAAPASAATAPIAGTYRAVPPARVLDTAHGVGAKGAVGAKRSVTIDATRTLGTASAGVVMLTVTAVRPTASGSLVVYPGGAARPAITSVDFDAGHSVANSVPVRVNSSGNVTVYNNSAGSTDLIATISGYWVAGTVSSDTAGALKAVPTTRIADSRSAGSSSIPAGSSTAVTVTGKGGIPSGATAVLVNIAAFSNSAGTVTADAEEQQPADGTSVLTLRPGAARANLAAVPVNSDGTITLHNSSTTATSYLIEAYGYYVSGGPSDNGSFLSSNPYRVADGTSVPAGKSVKVTLLDPSQVATFKAVVVNVTAANPAGNGYMNTWSGNGSAPTPTIVTLTPGYPQATLLTIPILSDGTISVLNATGAAFTLNVDVQGFVLNDLSGSPQSIRARTAKALVDAHSRAVR